MPLHNRSIARYSIEDAARRIGISEHSLGERIARGEIAVERLGSSGGTKINFIPADEIPRIRRQLDDEAKLAENRRVAEEIAEERHNARLEYERMQRDADAFAARYGGFEPEE